MSLDPNPTPVHVTIATAAAMGDGRKAIADRLGLTPREVQQIADQHGIPLRRPGNPGLPEADRLAHRVAVRLTPAEFQAIAAEAIEAGTTPAGWLRAIGTAAAQGQTLRAAAEAARSGGAR